MNLDMLIMNIAKGMAPCAISLDIGTADIPSSFNGDVTEYNKLVIDAVSDIAPAISLNVPVLLTCGKTVVEDTIAYAKEKGMYVIADIKSVGEPIAAVAEAQYYYEVLDVDCVTVSAYYGAKGIAPFVETCDAKNKTMFVLSHTDSGSPQDLQELMAGLRMVYRAICEKIAIMSGKKSGQMGFSNVGIMIGGVSNLVLRELRNSYKNMFFLITGYDGKKVTAHDLNGAFDLRGLGGIVQVSRLVTLPDGDGDLRERIKSSMQEVARDLRLCF